MRELSLFSGAGGGLLASRLLGWRAIGYVEFNDYCQRVLAQRIEDGHLDRAPIFGDIRAFISDGYAERYRGVVDVVSGGFPCQPFSVAGKQAAADDPRNMWPQTRDVLRMVRPRFAFLENVPGLLNGSHGYFGTILSDLAEIGYDARWCVLSAADCGAPHIRKRLWVLCYPHCEGEPTQPVHAEAPGVPSPLADTPGNRRPAKGQRTKAGYADGKSELQRERPACWESESGFCRVADGVASRLDRLRAIGNGQVPQVAATAWRILSEL